MEANKENINRHIVKTKLPLPKPPLPPITYHLLVKKIQEVPVSEDKNRRGRIPLETINSLSGLPAGSSTGVFQEETNNKDSSIISISDDEEEDEQLDWHHEVFKEETNNKDSSTISIRDDEEEDEQLDWHHEVFKEETNNKDSSIISISDDEE